MDNLSGKVALITGAGSGIGRGIALACADEGMHVVLADVQEGTAQAVAAEAEAREVSALAVDLDVADTVAYEWLAERVYDEFGELNLLVNNAGVMTAGPVSEGTQADWDWTFRVNLFGVINGVNAFLPRMRSQDGDAHIVNTVSMAGLRLNEVIPLGVYSSSKHAALAYTESLRDELAAEGIGVSALCPGGVDTLIGMAERNRPREFGGPSDDPARGFSPGMMSQQMNPEDVGRVVIRGVKANRRLIFSHPELRDQVERRYQRIMDDFDFFANA
ncbi:MAG: SDR family NAD(P)-dependent oxidoreductase [Chloroflexi bacterium]|nr:SDR family NAD(P)-dependent oxidoreductase [Chloroflexota bacterium]